MRNTSTEERELHTAQNIINAGTGQSADVEQMCEWFEKHPKARKLLTDAELLAGEIATIDPERKERNLARLRTRVRGYSGRGWFDGRRFPWRHLPRWFCCVSEFLNI
ncbi:MAG: hypothetical protein ACLU4N_26870 [Butyricimonas faecihominis]